MFKNGKSIISLVSLLLLMIIPDVIADNSMFDSSLSKINDYEYKTNKNLVTDICYKNLDNSYNMIIEIPAGTLDKWQTKPSNGNIYLEFINNHPRQINYLPYPGNYGFIPQTIQSVNEGGDGDPLDIILLSETRPRGSVQKVIIIGALYFKDNGESDHKIIALYPDEAFSNISSLSEMIKVHPEVIKTLKSWFENYKGKDKMKFIDYLSKKETIEMIEASHNEFLQDK